LPIIWNDGKRREEKRRGGEEEIDGGSGVKREGRVIEQWQMKAPCQYAQLIILFGTARAVECKQIWMT